MSKVRVKLNSIDIEMLNRICDAIKDLATNEFLINFDENYTQISSDASGNYFDVYMSGLEPERYYKILIKTIINNSTLILDNDYYFKVIN